MAVVRVIFRARPPAYYSRKSLRKWYITFAGYLPYNWRERCWIYPQKWCHRRLWSGKGVQNEKRVRSDFYKYVEPKHVQSRDPHNTVYELVDRWSRGMAGR